MHAFNNSVVAFDRNDMQLIESVTIRASDKSIAFPLARAEGEGSLSYFQRLIDYAKNLGVNQI